MTRPTIYLERITFRTSTEQRKQLERRAEKVDREPSYIIRAALDEYLARQASTERS